MAYLALIGDICDSRTVAERGDLQLTLQETLDELNKQHRQALASPLTITLGDEFQALLSDPAPVWQMVASIQSRLFPVQFRFALGLGGIDTTINARAALGMDGPAFHIARDAIDRLKKQGGWYQVEGIPEVDLANQSLALVSHFQGQWQHRRFQVYEMYLAGLSANDMSEQLKISRSAVYKNINDGALAVVAGITGAIATSMQRELAADHAD